LVFFVGIYTISAQEYDVIEWSSDQKLSWTDFNAEPPNSRAAAITASGITYRFSSDINGDEVIVDFTITAHFYPNKSWYKKDLSSAYILAHEQLHFDISEIFARKMRKRMNATRFTSNVRKEVKKIYQQINEEMNDFQNSYDKETNFSRDTEQQLVWSKKIEKLLESN